MLIVQIVAIFPSFENHIDDWEYECRFILIVSILEEEGSLQVYIPAYKSKNAGIYIIYAPFIIWPKTV